LLLLLWSDKLNEFQMHLKMRLRLVSAPRVLFFVHIWYFKWMHDERQARMFGQAYYNIF